ncbi:hypothetical protein [Streptomyces sp. AV19]|uniref:hypothetical protein n=1 Tax=Streptomyces sp. AV19 TaxID=2793068 RepID=UPI002413CC84|nr:hypothetical protein [Streptomyces sp. AV19]MDG4534786.1 hypothetical protein [Streptomyces sp. AV19]
MAREYAVIRAQFGRPIGSFQLIQDLLVKMPGNITATSGMVVRLDQHWSPPAGTAPNRPRSPRRSPRRRRGRPLLRGLPGNEHPHRRKGPHRVQRLRVTGGRARLSEAGPFPEMVRPHSAGPTGRAA